MAPGLETAGDAGKSIVGGAARSSGLAVAAIPAVATFVKKGTPGHTAVAR